MWHQSIRRTVVRQLAHLQCSLLGHLDATAHPDMLTLPPTAAGRRIRAVAREWHALPADHPLHAGPDLVRSAERAADVLDRRTAEIGTAVPLGLEFNDVYPANICADRSTGTLKLRFFDFGNSIWGHPFVTLHGFLDSVEEWTEQPLSRQDRGALYDDYLAVWRERLDSAAEPLHNDLIATRVLIHVHRLLSWLRLVPYADPIEIRARAQIPRRWMADVVALAG